MQLGFVVFVVNIFALLQVLKGLALLRLGRHDESTALLQEVHALNPSDEATLQAMGIAYRELHKCRTF